MSSADQDQGPIADELACHLRDQLHLQQRFGMDVGQDVTGDRWYLLVSETADQAQINAALDQLQQQGTLKGHRYIDANSPITIAALA